MTELIGRHGFASLADLTQSLEVSESTIRRDLEQLEQQGVLRRTHGGAVAAENPVIPAIEDRARAARPEKQAIARVAAALIQDGETVLLDGGTTTLAVARQLAGRPLQVVTNSLPIGHLLAGDRRIELTMIGGSVHPRTGVALGPMACRCLESLHARRLVMSVAGVNERGLFNSNALLVETELHMMQAAQEVIVVADHTKFGHQSLAFLCEWSRVHRVVSDSGLAEPYRELVRKAGPELVLAEMESEAQV